MGRAPGTGCDPNPNPPLHQRLSLSSGLSHPPGDAVLSHLPLGPSPGEVAVRPSALLEGSGDSRGSGFHAFSVSLSLIGDWRRSLRGPWCSSSENNPVTHGEASRSSCLAFPGCSGQGTTSGGEEPLLAKALRNSGDPLHQPAMWPRRPLPSADLLRASGMCQALGKEFNVCPGSPSCPVTGRD